CSTRRATFCTDSTVTPLGTRRSPSRVNLSLNSISGAPLDFDREAVQHTDLDAGHAARGDVILRVVDDTPGGVAGRGERQLRDLVTGDDGVHRGSVVRGRACARDRELVGAV